MVECSFTSEMVEGSFKSRSGALIYESSAPEELTEQIPKDFYHYFKNLGPESLYIL